jgi:Spy/CpxP family protein refolding chaperone
MVPSTYSSGMMRNRHYSLPHASASERPSSLIFTIGVISVTANVLLAAMLFRQHSMPRVADAATASDGAETAHTSSGPETRVAAIATDKDPLADFQWGQLESSDLKDYINNLRTFGVPGRTVRALVVARVERLYRPRLGPLQRANRGVKTNFWENSPFGFAQDRNLTSDQRTQLRSLQTEQKDLVKSLLGNDVYQQMARDSGYPDWSERMFGGSVPRDKQDLLTEMQQRYQEARSEAYAKADGMPDQETQAEISELERKFRKELTAALTPEQMFEYELRSSDLAGNLKFQLGAFEPNEQEYRAIFAYKQSHDGTSDITPEARKEAERVFEETIGPERLKEYYLLQDSTYQNLAMAGVSKDAILKVAETKSQTEAAAAQIRQDKSLTPEQRTQTLQALRTSTETTLADLLGQRRVRYFANSSGSWLRNIAPPDRPRSQ